MTKFRTVKRKGKKRVVPIGTRETAIVRQLTPREIEDLTGVGIRHPGSLTGLGYHISAPTWEKHAALNRAVQKYGMKEVLRKLGELYRLDYNRPQMREQIVSDIRYVSGGGKK
jgi:hypothetical protein